jgi:hypothetical protein
VKFKPTNLREKASQDLDQIIEQVTELCPILILSNQLSNVFTTRAKASLTDLVINETFEGIWKGYIHRTHKR